MLKSLVNEHIVDIRASQKILLALNASQKLLASPIANNVAIGNNIITENGNSDASSVVPIDFGTEKIAQIRCQGDYALALTTNGFLYQWGKHLLFPHRVRSLNRVSTVFAGSHFCIATSGLMANADEARPAELDLRAKHKTMQLAIVALEAPERCGEIGKFKYQVSISHLAHDKLEIGFMPASHAGKPFSEIYRSVTGTHSLAEIAFINVVDLPAIGSGETVVVIIVGEQYAHSAPFTLAAPAIGVSFPKKIDFDSSGTATIVFPPHLPELLDKKQQVVIFSNNIELLSTIDFTNKPPYTLDYQVPFNNGQPIRVLGKGRVLLRLFVLSLFFFFFRF